MKSLTFLFAAVALTLNAQDTKPAAEVKPAVAEIVKPAATKEEQKFFAQLWIATSPQEFINFQRRIQLLTQQVEEFKRSQVFLENALTTPEREARGHEIAAKQAKLQADNEAMGKLYNGFSIQRPYQLLPTKLLFLTPLSNDEFTKVSAEKDFKPDSVLTIDDKKFLVRDTISGAVEVETFQALLKQIAETKNQLQQLIDLQPKLKTDDDKKKAEEAVKATQDRTNKLAEEFKKARGFDYPAENGTLPAEAKLFVQISEAEKAQLEKVNAKPEEKKEAPKADDKK